MDLQDGSNFNLNLGDVYPSFDSPQLQNGEAAMPSPDSKPPSKLQLPVSCDPPGPGNPAKQLVWIVHPLLHSIIYQSVHKITHRHTSLTPPRSLAAQGTWAAP
jgi:hypothetical protein